MSCVYLNCSAPVMRTAFSKERCFEGIQWFTEGTRAGIPKKSFKIDAHTTNDTVASFIQSLIWEKIFPKESADGVVAYLTSQICAELKIAQGANIENIYFYPSKTQDHGYAVTVIIPMENERSGRPFFSSFAKEPGLLPESHQGHWDKFTNVFKKMSIIDGTIFI